VSWKSGSCGGLSLDVSPEPLAGDPRGLGGGRTETGLAWPEVLHSELGAGSTAAARLMGCKESKPEDVEGRPHYKWELTLGIQRFHDHVICSVQADQVLNVKVAVPMQMNTVHGWFTNANGSPMHLLRLTPALSTHPHVLHGGMSGQRRRPHIKTRVRPFASSAYTRRTTKSENHGQRFTTAYMARPYMTTKHGEMRAAIAPQSPCGAGSLCMWKILMTVLEEVVVKVTAGWLYLAIHRKLYGSNRPVNSSRLPLQLAR
jgi:hypothetical protein